MKMTYGLAAIDGVSAVSWFVVGFVDLDESDIVIGLLVLLVLALVIVAATWMRSLRTPPDRPASRRGSLPERLLPVEEPETPLACIELPSASDELLEATKMREQAEADMRESESRLRDIFESSMDCIIFLDEQGTVVEFNRASERTFGYSRREVIGKELADVIFTPTRQTQFRKNLARYLTEGVEGSIMAKRVDEIDARKKDGHVFPAELTTQPIPMKGSAGFVVFLRNVTERVEGERALKEAKELADAANRAKSLFLATMSHDIRTPMNAIIGMTELVLDTELDDSQREYLRMVRESGESLLSLLNDILDFSKIEAGKLDLDRMPFALRDALGDAMKSLAVRACGKDVEVICRIRPDVPDRLSGDPNRLRQIVINLAGNAIKFTEQGEVLLDVQLQSQVDGDVELHFSVSDTGIGIPVEKLGSVFGAFEQVDLATTRKFGGTGLGLAISSRLVELMGGKIWVESEYGTGSQFHFTAKLAVDTESAPEQPASDVSFDPQTRILLAARNATLRETVRDLLRGCAIEPVVAADGVVALQMIDEARQAQQPFDLLIVDSRLSNMECQRFLRQVAEGQCYDGPVVLLLGAGEPLRCADERVPIKIAAKLIKPIKGAELIAAIGAALGTRTEIRPAAAKVADLSVVAPRRILLVEDSLVNQKLALGLLGKHGHEITVAGTGQEAIEAAKLQAFDVVLMDVELPDMDGLEATRRIRGHEQVSGGHMPIIAMTAHAMKGDRERCLAAGMDEYISKPIRPAELYAKIAALPSVSDDTSILDC